MTAWSSKDQASLIRIRDAILNALTIQQAKRSQYNGADWIDAERFVMQREVNEWRLQFGLRLVDVAAIKRAERMASGHSDYSSKFALYCAEIAMGVKDPQP